MIRTILKSNFLHSEKLDHTYLFADFLKSTIIDISSKIICENTSIMLLFCGGRTVILRPSFARETTTANLSSLKSNLDINNVTSSSILECFSLYFSNSRLMSSILNQLIRWEACFADREQTSPTKSLRVDFTIEGDDEEDEGDNDGDVEKELFTV